MIFNKTELKDAYIIELEKIEDNRGFFVRSWCRDEFNKKGLDSNLVQCNISYNKKKATLRGMHYQAFPHEETKLIRCISGAIYDVIIDLRRESSTFKQWTAVELSSKNRRALYIPAGFAHGYMTLTDDAEVFYQVSEVYSPAYEKGVRWDDPAFGIKWPYMDEIVISEKDKKWSNFTI